MIVTTKTAALVVMDRCPHYAVLVRLLDGLILSPFATGTRGLHGGRFAGICRHTDIKHQFQQDGFEG